MSCSEESLSREELLAALADRDTTIAALLAEIAELKRRLGMDSSNSSMPPSSDSLGARARRKRRRERKPPDRKRGGQPGHPGSGLQRAAVPDEVVVVSPQACPGCRADLSGVAGTVAESVQVFDIPPVKLAVTEYRMLKVTCPGCGTASRAANPAGVSGPCCYGPNVANATALLAAGGHVSIGRAADLMGVLLDARVSTGFAGSMVARLDRRLAGFEDALKAALRAAPVLHHDETPARIAGDDGDRLCYIYTARAGDLVWYGAADNRGHAALDSFAILPGYRGTLVRDDYPAYAKYDKDLAAVQLCCAHILRALHGIADLDADGENVQGCWANEVKAVLLEAKAAVDATRAAGSDRLDADLLADLRARYDQALAWGVATNRHRDWHKGRHPGYTLARRLQARASQVWRFAIDFSVPFTNNPAEQPQRMVKLQMKIGGCWRSVRTATRYCRVRSYLDTARRHGIHPLDAIRDALAGNPWMPAQTA
jgi:transposase